MDQQTKVKILDPKTANQIAAGEVVERPLSVVKELVENAIDSGAGRIDVKIPGSGIHKIQVSDNGCGMIPEDMLQAVKRHATSKIRTLEDLDMLSTLGFRGEALPAIAAVSRMTITSRVPGNISAYTLKIEGGQAEIPQEIGAPDGTTVVVEDLFYNTPARKKFLKSDTWEMGLIHELMEKMAISHPEIAFSLTQGSKITLKTNGSNQLAQVVLSLYGKDLLSNMIKVEWLQDLIINGLVSLPDLNRSTRQHYDFFINGRWVKSKELAAIVDEAYHTLLPHKRYPLVMLFLQIHPSQIDVNVHPTKMEVKFKDIKTVKGTLLSAISAALRKKEVAAPRLGNLGGGGQNRPVNTPGSDAYHIEEKSARNSAANSSLTIKEPLIGDLLQSLYQNSTSPAYDVRHDQNAVLSPDAGLIGSDAEIALDEKTAKDEQIRFSSLQVLGQLGGSYIAVYNEEGLYLIDQHAAHERILYEKLKKRVLAENVKSHMLAMPLTLNLTQREKLCLVDMILDLHKLGFIVEEFGNNTVLLRGVPDWVQNSAADDLLLSLIEDMLETGQTNPYLREEELFMNACKKAVKANMRLQESDIINLLAELDHCQNPLTCPHGRPLIIKITLSEIRRRFLRGGI